SMMPDRVAPFIAARDLLSRLRNDYGAAVREFRWPVMDRFNWAHASLTGRFGRLPGQYTRIAVGGATGWHRFEDAYHAAGAFAPDGETLATDPLVLYLTSGTFGAELCRAGDDRYR